VHLLIFFNSLQQVIIPSRPLLPLFLILRFQQAECGWLATVIAAGKFFSQLFRVELLLS
jgi:hypothetical protein